jgi:hypothetical protein
LPARITGETDRALTAQVFHFAIAHGYAVECLKAYAVQAVVLEVQVFNFYPGHALTMNADQMMAVSMV